MGRQSALWERGYGLGCGSLRGGDDMCSPRRARQLRRSARWFCAWQSLNPMAVHSDDRAKNEHRILRNLRPTRVPRLVDVMVIDRVGLDDLRWRRDSRRREGGT